MRFSYPYRPAQLMLVGYADREPRYYHFGVVKAHLDADLLPTVITGTSGGALVAAFVCTRTNDELKKLLVPELAYKITACHDDVLVRASRVFLAHWSSR